MNFNRIILLALAIALLPTFSFAGKPDREFYQLMVYHYNNETQQRVLDNYLQNALLPGLHRAGITGVGIFKAITNDTAVDKLLYVFMAVKSLNRIITIWDKLGKDTAYQSAGAEYVNAIYTNPPYTRIETIFLRAFPLAPQMQWPSLKSPMEERVYELRSYESATEKIFQNKVQMFNEGDEIGLFKKLKFNAIFYSSVIAGGKMPNLMYMTCFENMADRDTHWKTFSNDPFWKELSSKPEYKNNVSHIDITFLRPVSYSDF